jgi:hypothetical protein
MSAAVPRRCRTWPPQRAVRPSLHVPSRLECVPRLSASVSVVPTCRYAGTASSEQQSRVYVGFPACFAPCLIIGRYHHGLGVPRNVSKAVRLYKLAAAENLPCAQFNLGFMFQRGIGVEQDVCEAIRLYKLAAEQGDPDACCSLAHVNQYIPCFPTYSAAVPRYVAIAHVITTWHLRRRNQLHQLAACCFQAPGATPAGFRAVHDSVEVTRAARLRVCSSGVATFMSMALAQTSVANSVICGWACSIAARVLGTCCIVVKASKYCVVVW